MLVALNAELDTGIAMNLMLGDCLERMKEIPDGSVDMILADPPYGTTACKWDSVIPFTRMWLELKRIIKPSGAIVLFGSEPFSSQLRISNLKMYKYDWIWDKENAANFSLANKQPMKIHENISVFYYKQPIYNPIKTKGNVNHTQGKIKNANSSELRGEMVRVADDVTGMKFPKSILRFSKHSSQLKLHPTQKPVALMEYLIKTYTQEGETVLDFVMGSGTSGIAAKNTGRKFIGIEKDAGYFEIAKQRLGV